MVNINVKNTNIHFSNLDQHILAPSTYHIQHIHFHRICIFLLPCAAFVPLLPFAKDTSLLQNVVVGVFVCLDQQWFC